jgi:nucleoside-triphosphatase THEP1
MIQRPIIVVTGEKGCGKSTLCEWCALEFQSKNYEVAGLLSISNYKKHEKNSIFVKSIRSGKTHFLAQRMKIVNNQSLTPRWKFNPKGLEWGNKQLSISVPCDFLIIDELGLLEFMNQRGWTQAFPILLRGNFRLALVVIRPQLLSKAKTILGEFIIFQIDLLNRESSKKRITQLCLKYLESKTSK